ncbi:hypothetical protein BB561_002942 [Smittium simulii]|uniref:Exocyst complex component EXO84 n=1 Tax=Smittium simulii TaxID=133385 RepID=A0A2T9YNL2_9FUNG|nr:hypothetical protein BB561_002942 [Smittium simulii]
MESLQPFLKGGFRTEKKTLPVPNIVPSKPIQKKLNDEPVVYLNKMMVTDFVAEDYLVETLEYSSEEKMREFRKALEDSKKVSAQSLQKTIYKNYKTLVTITNELLNLEDEVLLFQEMLGDLGLLENNLYNEELEMSDLSESEKKAARVISRRSIRMTNHEQQGLYAAQMTQLWNTVEGSQIMVPYSPNRHIIGVVKKFQELSPLTLQVKQNIQMVVLNDSLLIAYIRSNGIYNQTALVADKCMRINEITVIQLEDSSGIYPFLLYFFSRISKTAETYLFKFPNRSTKLELLSLIEKAISGSGSSSATAFQVKSSIALFPPEKMLEKNTIYKQKAEDVTKREEELVKLILMEIMAPCAPKNILAEKIKLLTHLGWGKEAKDAFLKSRSATIKYRSRQLKLEGNISMYIRELAVVCFRLIRNTCDWYPVFIEDQSMASALISWVQNEMTRYATIFRRQVFQSLQSFEVISNCIQYSLSEVEILGNAGLDLKFMLDQECFSDLIQCVVKYEQKTTKLLNKAIIEDNYAICKIINVSQNETNLQQKFGSKILLISSVIKLDEQLADFCKELKFILKDSLYGQIITSISSIIENILKQFLIALRKSQISLSQQISVLSNTQAVISYVIPRCARDLDKLFGRVVTDIHSLETRLEGFPGTLQDVFAQRNAQPFVMLSFNFNFPIYKEEGNLDQISPSEKAVYLIKQFNNLYKEMESYGLPRNHIMSTVIDNMFYVMLEDKSWLSTNNQTCSFSYKGVHQLVLDTHFFLKICGPLVSKSANRLANKVCEKALRIFFAANSTNEDPMMGRSWYDEKVQQSIDALGKSKKYIIMLFFKMRVIVYLRLNI